jgi:hypothetical protein
VIDTASRIGAAVYHNNPRVLCFSCLASQHGLREHDVRAAALMLITRGGLQLVARVCAACGRKDDMLVTRNAA